MLVFCLVSGLLRAGEIEALEGAVERVAVVRVDWEVLLRTERRETDRREDAAELIWDGRGEGMAAAEGRLDLGRAMTNGMRLMCAWEVYRTLTCSTRDRLSADTGRVREIEGAGQPISLRAPGLGCAWLGG